VSDKEKPRLVLCQEDIYAARRVRWPYNFDLRFQDKAFGLHAAFERVDAPLKHWLPMSWASRTLPAGYLALGGGAVCHKDREGLRVTAGEGEVDRIGSQGLTYG
jgi:hypothetical protein